MKIAFLGDIALIGKYDTTKMGQEAVFSRLEWAKTVLEDCDYVIANLESPLTNILNTHEPKSMPLRSNTQNVCVLKYLGIDAVSLANNHVYDYGEKGLTETLYTLDNAGIRWFGIDDEQLFLSDMGISVQGFCCFTANGWHYDSMSSNGRLHTLTFSNVKKFLDRSKSKDCYSIVIPHWGEENTHYPQSEHILLAERILENGNCSVVGHHPHVPQGIVLSNDNGLCAFSLGNFLFDDCYSEKNRMHVVQTEDNKKGFILILEFLDGVFTNYRSIPYYDGESGLVSDSDGVKQIDKYSNAITNLYGKPEYEELRQGEQKQARLKRLGKRDLKWLINHMNRSSVMSLLHGRENQTQFAEVVSDFSLELNNVLSKTQVLYVGNFGMPTTNAAGKRVYANSLLLNRCGYNVLMIGTDPTIKGSVEKINDSLFYTSFPSLGKTTGKRYHKWLEHRINQVPGNIKLIVRYGSPGLAIFDRFLDEYGKNQRIPIIVDVVDWLGADSGNMLFRMAKGIDTFLEKAIFNKHGNGIITISSYLYHYYGKHYKHKMILPPLVEEYKYNKHYNQFPQIVYAGIPFRKGERVKNVHAIKDRLDIAVSCFARLEEKGVKFDFHIIGLTKEDYLTAFPDQRRDVENTKHIIFHGKQTMEDTQKMISTMDYSILLRERNRATMAGFPTKVVESLSLGVPVITTDTSDLSKYIVNGTNGYIINIDDYREAEKQIRSVLSCHNNSADLATDEGSINQSFLLDEYLAPFQEFLSSIL